MSKPEFASIFNLEFYRKKNKWILSGRPKDIPKHIPKQVKERSVQDVTYTVENDSHQDLNEAFVEKTVISSSGTEGNHEPAPMNSQSEILDNMESSQQSSADHQNEVDDEDELDTTSSTDFMLGASLAPHSSENDLTCLTHLL